MLDGEKYLIESDSGENGEIQNLNKYEFPSQFFDTMELLNVEFPPAEEGSIVSCYN